MASTMHNVTGEARYPKLFTSNRDMNEDFHGPDGAYTIDVLLGKEELDKVTKSGSRLKPKVVEDGIAIKFKRKHTHPTVEALGGPPKIVDADEKEWDNSVFIGNGSKVEVYFEVYDTKLGKGTRLAGVKVLELVEYEGGEGGGGAKLPF